MTQRLKGKTAIVTGGGGGIGRGCCLRLAREGAAVVVAGPRSENCEQTVKLVQDAGGQAVFCRTDISQESQCEKLVQLAVTEFGGLDILVNNAGIFPRATLEQTSERIWDQILAVNLKGPFFLCKLAVPEMRKRGGGSIINVGSVHGLGGAGKLFAYSVSKGGLLTLTKNLAVALANDGIRVNYLIPGWVLSDTEIRIQAGEGHDEDWLRNKASRLAMGRFQTPEDSAAAVAFLASDEAAMLTGSVLNVDAGYSVRCIGTEDE
ncbi:MAG: SDR family oxidoreductase [Acidobacteriota bacterium]